MHFDGLCPAVLLRRYKRFLADVEMPDGRVLTVHCPNTGAMTGCAEPGSKIWLSTSASKTRKYPHTWELVDTSSGLACIHSARANRVVEEAFAGAGVRGFEHYRRLRREVKYNGDSRADLLLQGDGGRVFVEVKSVTLCRGARLGVFPDAVSERARKHLQALTAVRDDVTRAVLVFCVMHNGIDTVSVAADIDPRYREALAEAMAAGVEVVALRAQVTPRGLEYAQRLPFALDISG